ncbi:MAG: response regulator transcription factor [Marinoscillum sp.]|uniref:response regulator n=1 Tax=Marinoscillum sp. TaxID=2024838 RepID=UPI0032F35231
MTKDILLVDDHAMIRIAIKEYLKGSSEFNIVAEAENGKEAFDILLSQPFDLVITDINMPVVSGLELIENIKLNFPDQLVLALTMDVSEKTIRKLYALGVSGYVVKNVGQREFIEALQQIFDHKKYFSDEVFKKISEIRDQSIAAQSGTKSLSEMEQQILKLLSKHTPSRLIADKLNISPLTTELLIKNLYRKAECKSIPGLILYGIENGMI